MQPAALRHSPTLLTIATQFRHLRRPQPPIHTTPATSSLCDDLHLSKRQQTPATANDQSSSTTSHPQAICEPPIRQFGSQGRSRPLKGWKSWVDDLQQTHQWIWKKVGIFDAIAASAYNIRWDTELIMCLAERWNPETNTFVFPWGESTISLEDIMVLGGFPVLGVSPVLTSFQNNHKCNKYAEIEGKLLKSFSVIYKNSYNSLSHYGWMDHFKGMGGEIEHVAFLVLWLSRDLTLLKEKIVSYNMEGVDDGSELVVWAPFQLVQLWAWERFPELSPKPVSLVQGEPRVARWHEVTKLKTQNLRLDDESVADSFIWRPYVLSLKNWVLPKFYCNDEMWVLIDSEVDEELLSFVRCLRASEFVGFDCVMQYLPHRVGLQFGMDQDIPDFVARSNADHELAWSSYAKSLEGLKLYIPPRLFEGDVTVQYSRWFRPLDLDDKLRTYVRRKRRRRKVRKLSQLLGGSFEKASFCSSFKGMTSQRPLNVDYGVASNVTLNGQEDARMCAHTPVEKDEGKKEKGSYLITISGSKCSEDSHSQNADSSMALNEAGNVQEAPIVPEAKRLCSVLAEDNNLGKDTVEVVMKQTCSSTC
uniref:Aminotransferase-like plant mobile domain-containing protein n=1 Tax=Chenopodium quinoa TaxID=63459 RepID=A0A803LYC7_CHEQI